MNGVRIRLVTVADADAIRAIRLRALAETPLAFGSTLARETAQPPERWTAWARDSAAAETQATYFAVDEAGGAPVGLVFGVLDADDPKLAHLFAMWVAPEARRSGAGGALVDAIVAWATARGARTMRTAVTLGNDGAARLYERAGFRDTGIREPLGHSDAETALLERPLARWRKGRGDTLAAMPLRAFPVLYAKDVERVAGFYTTLGFSEHARLPGPDGSAGFIGLRRDGAELAVTTEDSPRMLAGVEPGPGPRHELFVYVEDVDAAIAGVGAAGGSVLREAADMPWGERVGFVADPEGNVVSLAAPVRGAAT